MTIVMDPEGIDFDAVTDDAATSRQPGRAGRMAVTILVAAAIAFSPASLFGVAAWCLYRRREWQRICSR